MTILDDLRLAAPRGLDPAAQRLWRHGDDTGGIKGRRETLGDPPVPGDLWILSAGEDDFGSIDLALVLVTQVFEDDAQVLCVPVTSVEEPTCEMSLALSNSPLDIPLVVWPHLETGVGFQTLDRRLGAGLDAMTLVRLRRFANGDVPAPLATLSTSHEQVAVDEFVADLCQRMGAACYANTALEESA